MKQKLIALSHRYVTALRKHLKPGSGAGPPDRAASRLGRQAVALGLETLELARIHESALATLKVARGGKGSGQRAEIFLTEALLPMVEAHRAARRSKRVEADLKKSGVHYGKLLQDSLQLQEGLRQLTHKNLSAQEQDRLTMSHLLQDEIGQTLLGINVRLLSLKTAARGGANHLTKEIASAQRLVAESTRSIHRFAHELDIHQPA